MPIIGQISVGDGATFTPKIENDVLSWTNDKNLPNPESLDIVGATFTPAVSNAGVLSWSNNKGLPNPQSVDMAQAVVDKKPGWGIPLGYEYFTFNPNIPQGALPLFGGEYSRATYSDLWAWVQTQTGYLKTEAEWQDLSTANNGNVPYYSSGDGSTTFRVPSLKCWVKGANGTVSEVGSYLAAGLPNITGYFDIRRYGNNAKYVSVWTGGAISRENKADDAAPLNGATGPGDVDHVTIDASRSSSIYGNANTVVPESIVGMWLVKAYGTVVDTGTIDEQQYIDDRFAAAKDYTDSEVETGVPTGCVQAFAGQTTPAGWLLCDGSAVSRVTYAKLFSVIGTSYGDGDGSTTFNVPNLIDKFVQGNATAGTVKSAGLPNVIYEFGLRKGELTSGNFATIVFANTSTTISEVTSASGSVKLGSTAPTYDKVTLNSSLYNSIYGNSTTVQPPAVTMRYIIKY